MRKETIQVLTDGYGYEKLCEVNQENTWVMDNGFTRKCNDIITALQKTYETDSFRVLVDEGEEEDL